MKFIYLALVILIGWSACSSGDGGGDGTGAPNEKITFSGSPSALNGRWSGPGTANYPNQAPQDMTFTFEVSQLPAGFNLAIEGFDANGRSELTTEMTGHRIVNNTIFDVRDNANVGSAGAGGFRIGRPNIGIIIATMNAAGQLTVHAEEYYGSADYKASYDAILTHE